MLVTDSDGCNDGRLRAASEYGTNSPLSHETSCQRDLRCSSRGDDWVVATWRVALLRRRRGWLI